MATTMAMRLLLTAVVLLVSCAPSVDATGHDDVCDMCRRVTDTMERVLILNTTEGTGRFQGLTKKLCRYLPDNLRQTVRGVVVIVVQ